MITALNDIASASRNGGIATRIAGAAPHPVSAQPTGGEAGAAADAGQAGASPAGSAQTPAPGSSAAGSASTDPVRASDGEVDTRTFEAALRARVEADGEAGSASVRDSAVAPAVDIPMQGRSDALWQRFFVVSAPANPRPTKAESASDEAGGADATATPAVAPVGLSTPTPSLASMQFLPVVPLPPGSDAGTGPTRTPVPSTRKSGLSAGTPLSPTNDISTAVDVPVTPASAISRASATNGAAADAATSPLASQTPSVLPAWTPSVDPNAVSSGIADSVTAASDANAVLQTRGPLVQALGEHLQVTLARGAESAVIRLDPPSMGTIEITIRHEAGSLQVHLNASNGEVLGQLQGIGDALRQDLIQRHQGSVSVHVSDDTNDTTGRQAQTGGGREEPEEAPRNALDTEEPTKFTLA